MMMRFMKATAVILLMVSSFAVMAATLSPAQSLIRASTDRMITAINTNEEGVKDDAAQVVVLAERYVLDNFDFVRISQLALGKHWRKSTREQKIRFVKAFRQLLVRTYTRAILEYADFKINYLNDRGDITTGRIKVRTEVEQPGGTPIPLDYDLYLNKQGQWKVYGIAIDGVNLVANYRTSFSAEVRRSKGMDGLLDKLEERNREAAKKGRLENG